MAVSVISAQDKETNRKLSKYYDLLWKAKAWKQEKECRSCGSIFRFDATDLTPTQDYGWCFYSPYIKCPVCESWHTFWFKTHFVERWIGKFLQLRWDLRDVLGLEWSWNGGWPKEPPAKALPPPTSEEDFEIVEQDPEAFMLDPSLPEKRIIDL